MKKFKYGSVIILVLLLLFSLIGCGKEEPEKIDELSSSDKAYLEENGYMCTLANYKELCELNGIDNQGVYKTLTATKISEDEFLTCYYFESSSKAKTYYNKLKYPLSLIDDSEMDVYMVETTVYYGKVASVKLIKEK